MTVRRPLLAVIVGLAVLTVPTAALAAQLTVTSKRLTVIALPVTITTASSTAVADTFTNQASPTTNSGTGTTMTVQSALLANRRSFVRFDLSAIPSSARVQSATLQLTMSTAPTASRTYEVDRLLATWSETTLTWNTMPSAAGASATATSGTTSGANLTWDVTGDVSTFVAGTGTNFGWQIKDTVESSATTRTATFRTREFTTASQRPTLIVVYAI